MRMYYPGAEDNCDQCVHQKFSDEEGETHLWCEVLPWNKTVLHWRCMDEDSASFTPNGFWTEEES